MYKISGVIITYNEEQNIERCLNSLLGVVDEIVVVDSFSTDLTKEICAKFEVNFIANKFEGHIEQKNFAMNQSKNNWVLSLDADEVLSKQLRESVLQWKANPNEDIKGFWMNRLNNYCGQWIKHGGWYPDKKIRLWNRNFGNWQGDNPHDFVTMHKATDQVGYLKGDLLHYTFTDVAQHKKQCEYFGRIGGEAAFKKGKRTNAVILYLWPLFSFWSGYIFKLGFLDGKSGYSIAKYSRYAKYIKYKTILNLQKQQKQ